MSDANKPVAWIPIEERLPNEYETVLVATGGGVSAAEIRFPDDECGMDEPWWMVFKDKRDCDMAWAGLVDFRDVTHWMPLPAPPSAASSGITARELFESLTHRQRVLLLEAIGAIPRWVVCGNAIQRTAAAPVVFVRAYRSHRRGGMTVRQAAYWAWRWAQAFCF